MRAQALGRAAATLRIDDDQRRQAGHIVNLLGNGHAFLDVFETHDARILGNDRTGVRIPAGERGAGLDGLPLVNLQRRAGDTDIF